jgi:predicted metal-dependent phosphoesterase TrpH
MPRADLHVHSCFSCDVPLLQFLTPRALFEQALDSPDAAKRMDYFCLTDHDTLAGYQDLIKQLPEDDCRLVIPAVEHTLRDPDIGFTIHANLYFIDPDNYGDLCRRVVTLDELLEYCDRNNVLCQYNHPTWWELEDRWAGVKDYSMVTRCAKRFQVLELNAKRSANANLGTMRLAHELGKVLTSNSDTHSGDIGRACNTAPGNTAREVMDNIWQGAGRTDFDFLQDLQLFTEPVTS